MSIALFRIDDRLIHGQVVVGWGQPLHVGFIVLVDDAVRASPWEQDLYRMGVPSDVEVVAMNHLLRYSGVDSARQFNERLLHRMAQRREMLEYLEEDYE